MATPLQRRLGLPGRRGLRVIRIGLAVVLRSWEVGSVIRNVSWKNSCL
jgi:hypothetical protein